MLPVHLHQNHIRSGIKLPYDVNVQNFRKYHFQNQESLRPLSHTAGFYGITLTVSAVEMYFRLILVPEYGAKTYRFMTFLKLTPYPRYRRPWKGVSAQRYVSVDPESEEGPGIPPKSGALERHFLAGTIEDLFDVSHR